MHLRHLHLQRRRLRPLLRHVCELPSSDADYLQNPKPPYPSMSKKLNEQGTVIMRVLIGADGLP